MIEIPRDAPGAIAAAAAACLCCRSVCPDGHRRRTIPLPFACFVEAARNARLDTPKRCSHAGKACPAT
jgi:hypothetical protein